MNLFLIHFSSSTMLHAVSYLLGCLRELSNHNIQPSTTSLRCYIMVFLPQRPILPLLHSFRHEDMLVFRTRSFRAHRIKKRLKLKASYIVSEVLWTLIQESWIRKPYTIEISGGDAPAMPRMSLQSY